MFMNESEIDRTIDVLSSHAPQIAPYARFLGDWKDVVNANSDGWAHWGAGSRCAGGLMRLLDRAMDAVRRGDEDDIPGKTDFDKSLRSIRAAATRHRLEAPTLRQVAATPSP